MTCNRPLTLSFNCTIYADGRTPPQPECGKPAVQLHIIRISGHNTALLRCRAHAK